MTIKDPIVATRVRQSRAATAPGCDQPDIPYEDLENLSEHDRLIKLRTIYEAAKNSCNDKDAKAGFIQAIQTINDSLLDITDAVPTTPQELMGTYLGEFRDKLATTTRRTRPMGTNIKELDTYCDNLDKNGCEIDCIPPNSNFATNVPDDIDDPDFSGIEFKPSKQTNDPDFRPEGRKFVDFTDWDNKDKYSEEHESCLKDLQCTFEELEHPILELDDDPDENDALDLSVPISDITSGCANGDGLYDVMMTAIDSSIDMQFKNSRLDAKSFGEFYASAMTAAMQTTTQFLIQEKNLELEAERVRLQAMKDHLLIDRHKYEKQLQKLAAEKQVLEMEVLKKKLPLELAMLVQQTKAAEKQVEKAARDIELTEAQIVATYNGIAESNATNKLERARIKATTEKILKDIDEITLNGEVDRNLKETQIEQGKVAIRTAKFDAILKKHQAYSTKVQTEEAKVTGAANRRVMAADVQAKQKQASLYDQQRKTYIYGQRSEVLKLMKDMWTIQIDTLGAEGMAVEAIKGPELSSKIERAGLDVGL